MPELDILRAAAPKVAPPSPASRAHARSALARRIERSERRPTLAPRRVAALAGLAATAAAAVVVFLSVGIGGPDGASAASVLRAAAATALAQQPLVLGPSQFVYTRSTTAYLATATDGPDGSYSVLLPSERETWLARDRPGWLYEHSGRGRFLSDHDRTGWVAAGKPRLPGGNVTNIELSNSDGSTPPMFSLDLPADPGALWERLEAQARGKGSGLYAQMFQLVGDALRETFTTPQQRAALYEVAAQIPGVELVGSVTDPAGRPGFAVARDDAVQRIRYELVFDPQTAVLLAEVQTVLPGNPFHYPDGTVIGDAVYLESAVVDTVRMRPDGSTVSGACSHGAVQEDEPGCPG